MNMKEAKEFGISNKTLDEHGVDIGDLVCSDEFNRPGNQDYRDAAIKRLARSKVAFRSNCNIVYNLLEKYVSVKCPYCGNKTAVDGMSGNGESTTVRYNCNKCRASVTLSLPSDGFGARPKED